MVCLDSDIIIDFLKNDKNALKKISRIENKGNLSTTSINIFEILIGFLHVNQLAKYQELLKNLKVIEFDFESSEKAAKIFDDLRKKGEMLDPLDIMIASVVIANKETLMTNNIKHFERIKELKLEE